MIWRLAWPNGGEISDRKSDLIILCTKSVARGWLGDLTHRVAPIGEIHGNKLMWRIIGLLAVLGGVAVPPSYADQPAEQPYRIDFDGRFRTAVMIDGHGPFSFVIDTAASRTLIYEHVRAQLGLARSQPNDIIIYGINNSVSALPVKIDVLTVAGQQIDGLTLGVLPHDTAEAEPVDGILGIDVLARYLVVLNRDRMQLKLLPPDSPAADNYREWAVTSLMPRPLKDIPVNFWYLKLAIGQTKFISLFDLGADLSMMNWPAAERLGFREKDFHLPKALTKVVRDVLGTDEPVIIVTDLSFALGNRHWVGRSAMVANSDVFAHFNLDERPAVIVGSDLFRDNSLAIDFANHSLYMGPDVTKKSSSGSGFRKSKLGNLAYEN